MIKTTLALIAAASVTGMTALPTSSAIAPQSIDLTAGTICLIKSDGQTQLKRAEKPDFAFRYTTQSGRVLSIRL